MTKINGKYHLRKHKGVIVKYTWGYGQRWWEARMAKDGKVTGLAHTRLDDMTAEINKLHEMGWQ